MNLTETFLARKRQEHREQDESEEEGAGHGEIMVTLLPRPVRALLGRQVDLVAAGAYHMVALEHSGRVLTLGSNASGQLGGSFLDVSASLCCLRAAALEPLLLTPAHAHPFQAPATLPPARLCTRSAASLQGKRSSILPAAINSPSPLPTTASTAGAVPGACLGVDPLPSHALAHEPYVSRFCFF